MDPRVRALQALRHNGVRSEDSGSWDALLACVAGVCPLLPVTSLPEWPWSSFPQAAELRPPKEFYVEVMAALRDALAPRPPLRVQPGFVSGDAARRRSVAFMSAVGTQRLGTHDVAPLVRRGSPGVCNGPDLGRSAVAARLAARGAPTPVPAMAWPAEAGHEPRQRMTPQQEQFVATVRDVDVGVALADLRAARTSDSTKAANSAAYPLYRLVCSKLGCRRGRLRRTA